MEVVATDTISGTITDQGLESHPVTLPVIIVPGLGRHLFSVAVVSNTGIFTTFDGVQPRVEMGIITLPLKWLGDDQVLH